MYATMRKGSHEQVTRVHRVPSIPGQYGHSDFDAARCGAVAAHRMWAPIAAPPSAEAAAPLSHRCPACFSASTRPEGN